MQLLKQVDKYNILWYYLNMEYKLIRSQRKTLAIKILPNYEMLVLAPKKCSLSFINNFVNSKASWINKTISSIHEKNIKINKYTSLEKVYLFGQEYEVFDKQNHYEISEYYIKHTKTANKEKVLKKFFNKLAGEYLINRTIELSNILKLDYKSVKVISARQKWGSCNNLKEIKLNFRLIMLPKNLIDYVICHELCHLKQMNHSKEFWALLEKIGYKKTTIKQSFKEYNFVLQLL